MAGNSVVVPTYAQRIAFPWANQYEIMMMAGVTDRIVAIHPNVKLFPWLQKYTPDIENFCSPFSGIDVNIEELLTVKPDLVFVLENFTGVIEKCKAAGLTYVILSKPKTISDIRQDALFVGEVLGGTAGERIQQYEAYVDEKLKSINATLSGLSDDQKPSVLSVITDNALRVPGTGTIMEEWISVAGGKNVAQGFSGYQIANEEQILEWDPDVIMPPSNQTTDIFMTDAKFKDLSAVKNNKIYSNPHGFYDWQYTAPSIALQIQWAAQKLHPDLFPDLDIKQEVKYYHQTFLGCTLTDEDVEAILSPETYDATPAPAKS
jgi:iron complex transport system substrate-binding protein